MVVDIIAQTIRDKSAIKADDKLDGEAFPVFKLFREEFELYSTDVIKTVNVAGVFILGHENNGVLGVSGLGGILPSGEVVRVISSSNKYIEVFQSSELISSNSTGTLGSGDYTLGTSEKLESEIIYKNNANVDSATINITYTGDAPTLLELSNDDGTTWEVVALSTLNTFLSTGTELKYRITGTSTVITRVYVSYSSTPIDVSAEEEEETAPSITYGIFSGL